MDEKPRRRFPARFYESFCRLLYLQQPRFGIVDVTVSQGQFWQFDLVDLDNVAHEILWRRGEMAVLCRAPQLDDPHPPRSWTTWLPPSRCSWQLLASPAYGRLASGKSRVERPGFLCAAR